MAKFILEIDLGNSAMQRKEDIAWALERASMMVRYEFGNGIIRDDGNAVGFYKVVE